MIIKLPFICCKIFPFSECECVKRQRAKRELASLSLQNKIDLSFALSRQMREAGATQKEKRKEEKVLPSESQGVKNRKCESFCRTYVKEKQHQLPFSWNTDLYEKHFWKKCLVLLSCICFLHNKPVKKKEKVLFPFCILKYIKGLKMRLSYSYFSHMLWVKVVVALLFFLWTLTGVSSHRWGRHFAAATL